MVSANTFCMVCDGELEWTPSKAAAAAAVAGPDAALRLCEPVWVGAGDWVNEQALFKPKCVQPRGLPPP